MAEYFSPGDFFPTALELTDGARWLRENAVVATAAVVGLAGFSMARYYDLVKEANADNTEQALGADSDSDLDVLDLLAIQRAFEQVNLKRQLKKTADDEETSTNVSSAEDPPRSSEIRRSNSIAASLHQPDGRQSIYSLSDFETENPTSCESCGECGGACDPDWGWFVPMSPTESY
ncbi:TPA: hypothetical protein N0F65_009273 [Lagenidium giganteum]|uniref:Uncharacterized protein n=1 Tax=Lagenidium giganteum TaxID=4803 RepID=A0AAV2YMW8_9STRA|nr:TPA: hypothetical protein N0F65_009273 [Lagenidium giganteum]